jgi:hypothetical protein
MLPAEPLVPADGYIPEPPDDPMLSHAFMQASRSAGVAPSMLPMVQLLALHVVGSVMPPAYDPALIADPAEPLAGEFILSQLARHSVCMSDGLESQLLLHILL